MDTRCLDNLARKTSSHLNNLTTTTRQRRIRRLLRALSLAIIAHVILALALPELPKLTIPTVDRGRGITVFLRVTPEPEVFEQSLENPGLISDQLLATKPTTGLTPSHEGEEEQNTLAAPELNSDRNDSSQASPSGNESDSGLKPSVFIMRSSIQVFAQQEAFQHAEDNPDALQRFQRSFRSYASYRRRSRSDSYTDRYGDYYVRTASSSGDICFKQEKELQPDDFSTNMVMFFSCERGPIKLTLGGETEGETDGQSNIPVQPALSSDPVVTPK